MTHIDHVRGKGEGFGRSCEGSVWGKEDKGFLNRGTGQASGGSMRFVSWGQGEVGGVTRKP